MSAPSVDSLMHRVTRKKYKHHKLLEGIEPGMELYNFLRGRDLTDCSWEGLGLINKGSQEQQATGSKGEKYPSFCYVGL